MLRAIEILQKPRLYVLNILENYTVEQLNEVPAGFNNNIIWNLGHMVAAQQGICYVRTGVPILVEQDFFDAYKPGTKPEQFVDADGIKHIKGLMLSTLEQLELDYTNQIFKEYTPVVTRYGVELGNIDNAINFLPFHDGLHIGYIMSIRKVLTK